MEILSILPGFIIAVVGTLVVGLATSWVDRMVTARVQARVGPPWFQPVADILKLMGKETLVPQEGKQAGFLAAPLGGLAGVCLAAGLLFLSAFTGKGFVVDLVGVIYLLMIPAIALIIGASASGNPHAAVGASREMKQMLAYELPFLIVLAACVLKAGGSFRISEIIAQQKGIGFIGSPSGVIGFIVALICIQAKLGLVPFDAPEAEQEIMGGVITEYSGPPLALFKLTKAMLLCVLPALLVVLFFGPLVTVGPLLILGVLVYVIVVALICVIRNTNPRLRIDQVMKFFWGPWTLLALISLILAAAGH